MRLVITGTPGTGKTMLAQALAKHLNLAYYSLNALAKRQGKEGRKREKELEVDVAKLGRWVRRWFKEKRAFIVEGHLACEMHIPCDEVLVLRCHPQELERRLKRRGYSEQKRQENGLAEALDYCLVQAEAHYPRQTIVQLDFTKPLPARTVLKRLKRKKQDRVRWLPHMKKQLTE